MLSLQQTGLFWGEGCVQKENGSVGSLDPFPSAFLICWKSSHREIGTRFLQPCTSLGASLHHEGWDSGCRLQFSKALKLVRHCKHNSFGSWWPGGGPNRRPEFGSWVLIWVQLRLSSLKSEASGWLAEGGQRKFAKAGEMERTRLWGHSGLGCYWQLQYLGVISSLWLSVDHIHPLNGSWHQSPIVSWLQTKMVFPRGPLS